jgi:CheY-like chemotaxis protein
MSQQATVEPIDILLIDDDEVDAQLTKKVLKKDKLFNTLSSVKDGIEAMKFLHRESPYENAPRPDLILLDLNMPRKDGRETLAEIKADDSLKSIPVVVLTTSDAERDVAESYHLQASGFIAKPVNMKQFSTVIKSLTDYWLCVVRLPPK